MWRVKEEGRERLRLGVGGAAKRKGKGSKGMENEEWRGGEKIERMEKCGDIAAERMV